MSEYYLLSCLSVLSGKIRASESKTADKRNFGGILVDFVAATRVYTS